MAIRQIQPTAAASSAAKVPAQPVRPKTGAVGDHPETQFGEAIADQIGEGALDPIGGADRFFGTKPTAATPINSCGPNTVKPSANNEAR